MYYYALYGYLAYKTCNCINLLETAIYLVRGVRCAYRLLTPAEKSLIQDKPYVDWIMITDLQPDDSDWENIPTGKYIPEEDETEKMGSMIN